MNVLPYPLVSVIIPSYNHGSYLPDAIKSIQRQSYPHTEIIVVDDGSTDDTKAVAAKCPKVVYVYQENQGLSAARNTGILKSTGEFLVFLDADDMLYSHAISYNVTYLLSNPCAAFVSGAYEIIKETKENLDEDRSIVLRVHYLHLLKSNYIGMHGTVMYRRWVFNEFMYDVSLKACEDHDLYLRVTRKYPVIHHTKKLAAYRMHTTNMSGNIPLMLSQGLEMLKRQEPTLQSLEERKAYEEGITGYQEYYSIQLYGGLRSGQIKPTPEVLQLLQKYKPRLYNIYVLANLLMNKMKLKKMVPAFGFRLLNRLGLYHKYQPAIGMVQLGDFKRTTPFSFGFGYDRGGPVDRYYIENFLEAEAGSIQGRVLEIGDNEYTLRFGKDKVVQSDILHVDDSNQNATLVGDLSHAPHIPDQTFDCIVLTQTLHLVYNYKAVIETCFRILKPGGALLLTVPGITPIDYGEWEKNWLWSFTGLAMEKILNELFPINYLEINTYGNVFVATAFLYGMGLPELKKEELDIHDPHFQVIITAKAIKPA